MTAEGTPVQSAVVLSEGKKASSGALLMDREKAMYIPSSATDIKDLIEAIGAILDKVILITTTLDGVTLSPGSAAANIAELTALKIQLELSKETLK